MGIAISAAMLLDMVMLSGGIEKSFAELLLARGYQIRLTPKGTLPFDTEATLGGAGQLVAALRRDPQVVAAGAILGTSLYGRRGDDSLVTLFGYGIQPEAQALYQAAKRPRSLTRRYPRAASQRAPPPASFGPAQGTRLPWWVGWIRRWLPPR